MQFFSNKITSLPEDFNRSFFVTLCLGEPFCISNYLFSSESVLSCPKTTSARLLSQISGMELAEEIVLPSISHPIAVVAYPLFQPEVQCILDDMFACLSGISATVHFVFLPTDQKAMEKFQRDIERELTAFDTKESVTSVSKSGFLSNTSFSRHSDVFSNMDRRIVLQQMLNSHAEISMKNYSAYKCAIIVDGDKEQVLAYLKTKFADLEVQKMKPTTIIEILQQHVKLQGMHLTYAQCSTLISLPNAINRSKRIQTVPIKTQGSFLLGHILKDGVKEDQNEIRLDPSCLNLGSIVTGLPGTGKTMFCMNLMQQVASSKTRGVVIISPTEEWNPFAISNNLRVIKLQNDSTPINFFKCPNPNSTTEFYQNLAMLIASACNAGPYENSIAKCLLSAFLRIYKKTLCPDPVHAYNEIENTIIEQHGSFSGTSVKYTKHGENIKAALQSLRIVLSDPRYCFSESIDIKEALTAGVVFDLSKVSNAMKPMFYALILNQIYSLADGFDVLGDSKLRLCICVEEAQLVFSPSSTNAATQDIMQRIQDFRKRGIALMLITHNATDVYGGIRRICQNKFYFRQVSDIAMKIVPELGFSEEYNDKVAMKMRTLPQQHSLAFIINSFQNSKVPLGPFFMMTERNSKAAIIEPSIQQIVKPKLNDMQITLFSKRKPIPKCKISLLYLSERIEASITNDEGIAKFDNIILNRPYTLCVYGEKKRDTRKLHFVSAENVELSL